MGKYSETRMKSMIKYTVLLLLFIPLLFSCSGGSGGDGSDNKKTRDDLPDYISGTIQVNTDPADPMILQVTGKDKGDKVILFGKKNASGEPVLVEAFDYYPPDSQDPITVHIDDQAKPTSIIIPDHGVLTLTYEGDNVNLAYEDADGNIYYETLSLKDANIPALEPLGVQPAAGAREIAAENPTTIVPIKGSAFIHLITEDFGPTVGKVSNAVVKVTATNEAYKIPSPKGNNGQYDFIVPHQITDLKVLAQYCSDQLTVFSRAVNRIGVAGAIIGLITAFTTGPFGLLLTGIGINLGLLGEFAANDALQCEDFIRKSLIKSGQGYSIVSVAAEYNGASAADTVSYDLFKMDDPVTASQAFTLSLYFKITPKLESLTTVPSAPAVGDAYSLKVDAVIPKNGIIKYWITRDGNSIYSEEWVNSAEETSVSPVFGPIPAADSEAIDAVLMRAYMPDGTALNSIERIIKFVPKEDAAPTPPVGLWSVVVDEECDTRYRTYGSFRLNEDKSWVPLSAHCGSTDDTLTWSVAGSELEAKAVFPPGLLCSQCRYKGTLSNNNTSLKGKIIWSCQGEELANDCFEGTLNY